MTLVRWRVAAAALHNSERHWDRPSEFLPERWEEPQAESWWATYINIAYIAYVNIAYIVVPLASLLARSYKHGLIPASLHDGPIAPFSGLEGWPGVRLRHSTVANLGCLRPHSSSASN